MKRKIIVSILVIVLIGGIIAYRMYDQKTPDIVNQSPDFVTDVENLLLSFDKDSSAARLKYMDKIIQVKGNVKSIDTTGAIVLGEQSSSSSVVCGMDRRHLNDYQHIKPGNTAIIQGRCTGYEIGEEMLGVLLGTTIQISFAGVKSGK